MVNKAVMHAVMNGRNFFFEAGILLRKPPFSLKQNEENPFCIASSQGAFLLLTSQLTK